MTISRGWSTELEGLRGIASLWVLLGHISLLVNCHIKIISSPGIGVDLFILLSGYLMAKNYIERKDKEPWNCPSTVKNFWLRRFFRIAPLYYFLLVIALIAGPWYGEMRDLIASYYPGTATETSRYSDQSVANILAHFSFVFGFIPHYSFNTVLPDWSIGLEMQFYLLFPFIMLLSLRMGYSRALLTIMALCCAGRFILSEYYEAFTMPSMILIKLNVFISGMLLAEAVRLRSIWHVILALLGPVASVIIGPDTIKLQIAMEVLMIIGMALILWQYPEQSRFSGLIYWPRKLLNNPFSTWLGDVSYSVYLVHLLIIIPSIGMLLKVYGLHAYSPLLRFGVICLVCLPTVYFLSTLLYNLIEKKGIILGKGLLNTATGFVE
ncbi:MAG: acyltransferase [Pantoea sp.]|uniref:acyltransferase family protein n=1 Tax=Pantoea sp. TaxID=69393 RepID=UPI0039E41B8B